ncbi:L domain-like protein [Dichomitus squalens]|nr:L domain-like protein [Dichomitus squalens]
MEPEPGDEYIRRIAEYIRTHEAGLAAAAPLRRRPSKVSKPSEVSVLNPLGWFASNPNAVANAKPVVLAFDFHHLFYLLMRMEALGYQVGSLDIKVDSPSRPMNYISLPTNGDKSDALSFVSLRSSLSAVSRLSLGAGWFGRPPPPTVDAELRYIYRSFNVIPALSLHAPEPRLIAELAKDSPIENALPFEAFKNLQTLQCIDIDPRTILGWDKLASSLRSLTVTRSGLEDVSDIFIGAVKDDQARREGRVSSLKSRKLSRGVSRQSSFHSTQLPESVPEDAEGEDADADAESPALDTPKPLSSELPSSAWSLLRHLSLADNSLTFLPTSFLSYLTSVTHLDLSSNLLVSVPAGLSALYNLICLNLSDNMIDSVLGIYTNLGGVVTLNLSNNRLESICGLERLYALERVDLRHNLIEESAEVGRLATLPNISEVSVEGNPLVEIEEDYRIRCFDFFWKEKKSVLLDGSAPGFYEKRHLTSPPPEQMTSTRPPSVAYSPPVVAVGSPSKTNGVAHAQGSPLHASPNSSPASHPSHPAFPHPAAGHARGRRKKNKRIVDLDGGQEASEAASVKSVPRPTASRTISPAQRNGAPTHIQVPAPAPAPSTQEALAPLPTPTRAPPSAFSPPSSPPPQPTPTTFVKPKSRHSRHMTEFAPTAPSPTTEADDAFASLPEGRMIGHRKSSTLSRAQARRARVSASVYEPGNARGKESGNQFEEADAFRARIEALRSDMGEGWLKVFNQSQIGSPTRANATTSPS